MATASLSSVYGGGSFVPKFFSGCLSVPSGSTGNLISITPPAGQRVRLLSLTPGADSNTESGITITNSTGIVVNNLTLSDGNSALAGRFSVGCNSSGTSTTTSDSIPYIDSFGTIIVSKGSGSTSIVIFYCYAFG